MGLKPELNVDLLWSVTVARFHFFLKQLYSIITIDIELFVCLVMILVFLRI